MKNSLLILVVALVCFTNVSNAKSFASDLVAVFQTCLITEIDGQNPKENTIIKPVINEPFDEFDPETVIAFRGKSSKEVIAENDKITETNTTDDLEFAQYEISMKEFISQGDLIVENSNADKVYPLFHERTIEDEIAELELVIECTVSNEVYPLTVKAMDINFNLTALPKNFVGMD